MSRGASLPILAARVRLPIGSGRAFQCSPGSLATVAVLLCGWGASRQHSASGHSTRTVTTSFRGRRLATGEVLSVPAVGRIYGRCDPADRRWTIKFSNDAPATDGVTYRIGTGRSQMVAVDPGEVLVWKLVPSRYTSHEPADPISRFPAATIKTTAPVALQIIQGSEPHIYRVAIRFAVAAAIGDTTDCALISSSLSAMTYYPGGQPPG